MPPHGSPHGQGPGRPPLVSVVVPTYNAARTLLQTLDSVLSQTHPALELIVVDDGSTDDTPAVLEGWEARAGGTLRVVRKPNGGLASARNAGTRAATGDLVAMLDADDLCEPERLAEQVALMTAQPDLVLCSTDFSAFSAEGPVAASYAAEYYSMIARSPGGVAGLYPTAGPSLGTSRTYVGRVYEQLARGNFVHPPTVLFRRELFERVGPFDETKRFTSDWDWLVKAARLGPFGFVDRPLLRYRLSPSQMSGGKNRVRGALENLQILERICREDPELFARARSQLKAELAHFSFWAADALADEHPVDALVMLGRSVGHGRSPDEAALRVVGKALTPRPVLELARRLRAR